MTPLSTIFKDRIRPRWQLMQSVAADVCADHGVTLERLRRPVDPTDTRARYDAFARLLPRSEVTAPQIAFFFLCRDRTTVYKGASQHERGVA